MHLRSLGWGEQGRGPARSGYDINRVFESGEFGGLGCMFIIQVFRGWPWKGSEEWVPQGCYAQMQDLPSSEIHAYAIFQLSPLTGSVCL